LGPPHVAVDPVRLSCRKYFCACDRTWLTVRVPTTTAMTSATPGPSPTVTRPPFSPLSLDPNRFRLSRKRACSSADHGRRFCAQPTPEPTPTRVPLSSLPRADEQLSAPSLSSKSDTAEAVRLRCVSPAEDIACESAEPARLKAPDPARLKPPDPARLKPPEPARAKPLEGKCAQALALLPVRLMALAVRLKCPSPLDGILLNGKVGMELLIPALMPLIPLMHMLILPPMHMLEPTNISHDAGVAKPSAAMCPMGMGVGMSRLSTFEYPFEDAVLSRFEDAVLERHSPVCVIITPWPLATAIGGW